MPVTKEKPAPYAPAKTVLDIIDRFRQRGLPVPIDAETLERAGVAPTLLPRVIQALRSLDLMTDEGAPTATFEGIRLAPETEYKKRLEDWLKGTYADIFSFVDPAKDGETRIRDAFRGYQPVGQQERMVTLFTGLCAAAGLIAEKPARVAPSAKASLGTQTPSRRIVRERSKTAPKQSDTGNISGLPAPLAGLLASLPSEGSGWTAANRKKFLTTFETVLDFCFPTLSESDAVEDE